MIGLARREPRSTGMDDVQRPSDALVVMVMRTLRMIYLSFWFALAAYAIVLLWLVPLAHLHVGASPAGRPANWTQWQFLFAVTGIAALYLSHRIRPLLLGAGRLQAGAMRLEADRRVPDLIGRLTMRHALLWTLVEVPAVLGVIDRLVSGELRYFLALLGTSCLGLAVHRPTRERTIEILQPFLAPH